MRYNNLKLDADRSFKKGRTRERQNQESRKSRTDRNEKIELRNHKKVRPESNIINSMMSISKIETENMKRGKKTIFFKIIYFYKYPRIFCIKNYRWEQIFERKGVPFKIYRKSETSKPTQKFYFRQNFKRNSSV